jgi:hypothetical protein
MSRTEVQIYKDATIVAADIATDAVETAKIKDANVTKAKLENSVQTILTAPYPFTTRGFGNPI